MLKPNPNMKLYTTAKTYKFSTNFNEANAPEIKTAPRMQITRHPQAFIIAPTKGQLKWHTPYIAPGMANTAAWLCNKRQPVLQMSD